MSSVDKNMFKSCRSSSKFYTIVDEDEEAEQDSGKNSNSLEHLPLARLRSLKGNEEVYQRYNCS